MTIDEAIAFCVEKSNNIKLKAEPEVFIQLAEWLEELKRYREIGTIEGYKSAIECYTEEYTRRKSNEQYNKAIDDFVKALQEKIEKDLSNHDLALECKKCGIWKNYDIKEIAEQLKENSK